MELEKVRSYPTPGYPTAKEFHKLEKLTRYMPRRWRANRLVGQVLLLLFLTGLGASEKNIGTDPDAVTVGKWQHWQKRLTEADARSLLQNTTDRSSASVEPVGMPDWHDPEDWERDVEEYRLSHPSITTLSPNAALATLADMLSISKES